MGKKYSIAEVRDRLSEIVHQAEAGEEITVTRRGKPVAVMLAQEEYERLVHLRQRNLWQAIDEFRHGADFVGTELADEEIASWRDRGNGREFSWRD